MTPKESLWRHADFMRLWTAQTVSLVGSQVTQLALPLTAIVLLHAAPLAVGLLGVAQYSPFLVFGLPVGVWVDRRRRRPVLIVADLVRGGVLLLIPAAYALNVLTLTMLYPIAFVTGTMTVLFDVAHQSYLPSLVEVGQLTEGNSKLQLSQSAAQLAGPGLGGLLIQVVRAPAAILVDALSYFVSAACLFAIRRPEPAIPARGRGQSVADIRDGLRLVLGSPLLRPLTLTTTVSNFSFGGMLQSIFLLYATRTLGLSAVAIGAVLVAANGGGVVGAIVGRSLVTRIGPGRLMVAASVLGRVGALLIALAPRSLGLGVLSVGLLLAALGAVVFNINSVTVRQAITPDELRGRMNATVRFLSWGAIPAGAFIWGLLGGLIGLHTAIWLAVLVNVSATFVLILSPVPGLREMPTKVEGSVIEGARQVG